MSSISNGNDLEVVVNFPNRVRDLLIHAKAVHAAWVNNPDLPNPTPSLNEFKADIDELDKAEKKIEILMKDDQGGVRPEPFSLADAEGGAAEAAEPAKKPHPKVKKKDDDDVLPF